MDQHAEVVGFWETVACYPLRLLHCPRIVQAMYPHNVFRPIRQILQVKCNKGRMITVATGMTGIIASSCRRSRRSIFLGPLPLYQPLSILGGSAKTVRCDIKTQSFLLISNFAPPSPPSPPPVTPSFLTAMTFPVSLSCRSMITIPLILLITP